MHRRRWVQFASLKAAVLPHPPNTSSTVLRRPSSQLAVTSLRSMLARRPRGCCGAQVGKVGVVILADAGEGGRAESAKVAL